MASKDMVERTRAYQQEMFDKSLDGNKIIVMDTGSGKTQVAMLRIQAELDSCPPNKRVWFLAPSVELCTQQFAVLQDAMPAYRMVLLTGPDNIDKWSEQRIWNTALDGARVVVSTHAILADALGHGFVRLETLALLVFDEAHHCIKKHAANVIMRDFYHPMKASGISGLPKILGLSASLVMSSSLKSLPVIESNLDSVSITPRIHREELMRYVHRPECHIVQFAPFNSASSIGKDTVVNILHRARITLENKVTSHELDQSYDTHRLDLRYLQQVLQKFCTKAEHIQEQLGTWAADYFVKETLALLTRKSVVLADLQLETDDTTATALQRLLAEHGIEYCPSVDLDAALSVTNKVHKLIDFLSLESAEALSGIVFVTQRVVAIVLSGLLSQHSRTRDSLRPVPIVGMSNYSARKIGITELIDVSIQKEALNFFRTGRANIIIATSVLEEGIDVQTCNFVACFDPPANLKSFIQRRGRARHQRSRLGLFLPEDAGQSMVQQWHSLEQELAVICQQDRDLARQSEQQEMENERMDYLLEVQSTGARLNADSTLSHLHHFCNLLKGKREEDSRPQFVLIDDRTITTALSGRSLIRASVTLPQSVPASVRHAVSQKAWKTERAAEKDAAFQAYAGLHKAGLLNDHLLPLCQDWNTGDLDEEQDQPGRVQIEMYDPHTHLSRDWSRTEIALSTSAGPHSAAHVIHVSMHTRFKPVNTPPLVLYWDSIHTIQTTFSSTMSEILPSAKLEDLKNITTSIMHAARSRKRWHETGDCLVLLQPAHAADVDVQQEDRPLSLSTGQDQPPDLVRVASRDGASYKFESWGVDDTVVCSRLPRRRNFRTPAPQMIVDADHYRSERHEVFAVADCLTINAPLSWAQLGLLLPAITQHLDDFIVVDQALKAALKGINVVDRKHILTALTAPSAIRPIDYQRYEFIGDSILKYVVTYQLFSAHSEWPEGFLTRRRSAIVSNVALASAAMRTGLSQFIITEPVDYRNWRLPCKQIMPVVKQLSGKVLADVVEAVIGAIYLDSGMDMAAKCATLFLPDLTALPSPPHPTNQACRVAGKREQVEAMIGYTFADGSLLSEALTHPSYAEMARTNSYERLEFLGDAVLDMIIAQMLAESIDVLSQGRMTKIKAALVNAYTLGFFCFHLKHKSNINTVKTSSNGEHEVTISQCDTALADCVSFHSTAIGAAHHKSKQSYLECSAEILFELQTSDKHPWSKLERLHFAKRYSDIVESMLGAIFVDSGSLAACQMFLSRLGLIEYAERIMREGVDVEHTSHQSVQDASTCGAEESSP